jgi:hypothetical protein
MNGMEKCLFEFSSFQRFFKNKINTIVTNDEVTSRLFCTFCINLHLISFLLNQNSIQLNLNPSQFLHQFIITGSVENHRAQVILYWWMALLS